MLSNKLPQRLRSPPKLLLCLLLLPFSTGVAAQDCASSPSGCPKLSEMQQWVDQQQQILMCGQSQASCVTSGGGSRFFNTQICQIIGNLGNSVAACQSETQGNDPMMATSQCVFQVADQYLSLKSNNSTMLQPGLTCSPPPPPPPPPPPVAQTWCGIDFSGGTACGSTQQQCTENGGQDCSRTAPVNIQNPRNQIPWGE